MAKHLHGLLLRFAEIVARRDFEYAEFQGAYVALIWAGVLAWEWYWGEFIPAQIAGISPLIWSVVFLSIGLAQLFGLLRLNYSLRRSSAFCAGCLWAFVAATLGGEWRALLCVMAFALSMASFWGYVRIGRARALRTLRRQLMEASRLSPYC